jgi:uncharacterized protein YjbI with pentapeptide repeats
MKISHQDVHNKAKIKGKRLNQQSLCNDLQNVVAGQNLIFKGVLLLLIVLLCITASSFAGFIGGVISLYVTIENPASDAVRAMLLILIVTIASATTQDLARSIIVLLVSFFVVAIGGAILSASGLIQSFISFLLTLTAATAFCFGISGISYFVTRFTVALTDILFIRLRFLKAIGLLLVTSICMIGAYGAISSELEAKTQTYFQPILQASQDAQIKVLILGTVYGVSLVVSGWLSNHLRGTPWKYPSLHRFWALAVGSWWGTSFFKLDLSDVNFRGSNLANTDLRARILYRTCFQGAICLERARVDNQYLDLEYPKVQRLLTHGSSRDQDFRGFNLQGAYLQNADMRGFDLTNTNLTGADFKGADLRDSILIRTQLANTDFQGVDLRKNVLIDANLTEADLRGADLRGSILVRAQVARANFTGADLTGICIEDWSVSSKTRFTDVRCDYVFRKYQDGQPSDRYPVDRDFEPGEFASLFAEPEDVVELVFKGEFNIAALSLALYKLQTDAPELNLELKGIEQREKLWVAKIRSTSSILSEQLIEERLTSVYDNPSIGNITVEKTIKHSIYRDYEEMKHRLAESEQLNRQLAGVTGSQAEALKELSKRSFGNNFFISGSTITNLAGSGQIDYREAASSIRSLVTNRVDPHTTLQRLIGQLNDQNVATTSATQRDLIQQVLLSEANQDPTFRQFLLQQGEQIISSVPSEDIAIAVQAAISALYNS